MNQKIVIKFGSLVVTDSQGGVSKDKIEKVVKEIHDLKSQGYQVVVVSSGAINSGKKFIKHWDKDLQVTHQQAASALGQPILMQAYMLEFQKYNLTPAQILVTHEDFKNKERFINIRNTINCLLHNNHIPIINENDSTSFAEITVGDNDQLAAMITLAIDANMLLMLTETDGLYDRDPGLHQAQKIHRVEVSDNLAHIKFGAKTSVGRGGMLSKMQAIKKLAPFGIEVRLGSYLLPNPITRLFHDNAGTRFLPTLEAKNSHHKIWMGALSKNDSYLLIDEGAYQALKKHKSLLPIGVKKVVGKFKRGDVVQVRFQKKIVAHGLVEYSAVELDSIKGKKTEEISLILKSAPSKVAIHIDNLLVVS